MTLTPPVRVFALVGGLLAVGLAVFVFLLRPGGDDTTAASKPSAPRPSRRSRRARRRRTPSGTLLAPAALPASGFPLPIHRALRRNRVVVVAVYMPGASVDAVVRREARAGARAARAGYVAVSALSERLVRPLVAKTGVLPAPAVLVIARPGVVDGLPQRDRPRDRRPGRRAGAAMIEGDARPDPARELYVRHARVDGNSVALLRAIELGDSCVVEAEVWPVSADPRTAHSRRARTPSGARSRRRAS